MARADLGDGHGRRRGTEDQTVLARGDQVARRVGADAQAAGGGVSLGEPAQPRAGRGRGRVRDQRLGDAAGRGRGEPQVNARSHGGVRCRRPADHGRGPPAGEPQRQAVSVRAVWSVWSV